MEVIQFGGWSCARIVSNDVELFVTLDVGPRIIRLGFVGEKNELYVKESELGLRGGSEYRGYGGHRLWIAPECPDRTYTPDNEPVIVTESAETIRFQSVRDPFGMDRWIEIRSLQGGSFEVTHGVSNCSNESVKAAAWALTVMAPGGELTVPQEPFVLHGEALLPARPIVLWAYTKMTDPRFVWGDLFVRLQHADAPPTKFGALVKAGWAAHENDGALFVKTFGFDPNGEYPDYGCNFESFTRHDMLEVESLSPLKLLQPGDTILHEERWTLSRSPGLSENELERAAQLTKFVS